MDVLFSESTAFEDGVSTILSLIVLLGFSFPVRKTVI